MEDDDLDELLEEFEQQYSEPLPFKINLQQAELKSQSTPLERTQSVIPYDDPGGELSEASNLIKLREVPQDSEHKSVPQESEIIMDKSLPQESENMIDKLLQKESQIMMEKSL